MAPSSSQTALPYCPVRQSAIGNAKDRGPNSGLERQKIGNRPHQSAPEPVTPQIPHGRPVLYYGKTIIIYSAEHRIMHNVLYYHGKGLLKPIKPRPFIIQINRPHKSTQRPSAPHTPRGGPCLTKKGGHGYRTFHQKAHFLEKKPFFSCCARAPGTPCAPHPPMCARFCVHVRGILACVRALFFGEARAFAGPCVHF